MCLYKEGVTTGITFCYQSDGHITGGEGGLITGILWYIEIGLLEISADLERN